MSHDAETARRLVFHLDNLLHARVHTMLIVEAILLLAAMSRDDIRSGIALFAIALTLLFTLTNFNITRRLHWTMERWKETEPSGLVRDYALQRSVLPRSITVYTWWFPALLVIAWIAIAV